ncbi:transcription-repair coupling factor [Candidatus Xenohaliotis californiensis]
MNIIGDKNCNFIVIIDDDNLHAITTPINVIKKNILELRVGKTIAIDELNTFLNNAGYIKTSMAIEPGDFSIRGGIVDIVFAMVGYRIDFFDNLIESIREFDPVTQLGKKEVDFALLPPCIEVLLNKELLDEFLLRNSNFMFDELLHMPINKRMELLDIFYHEKCSLFHLLLENFSHCHFYITGGLQSHELKKYDICNNLFILNSISDSSADDQIKLIGGITQSILRAKFTIPESIKRFMYRTNNIVNLNITGDMVHKTVLSVNSLYTAGKISELMSKVNVKTIIVKNLNEVFTSSEDMLLLAVMSIDVSFVFRDVIFISERNVFGNNYRLVKTNKKKGDAFLKQISQLMDGDIVTHTEYGIGRFLGLKTISTHEIKGDFLALEYSGNEKLFIPANDIPCLTRYGESTNVVLDKLGTTSWQKRKAKAKARIFAIAKQLMNTAAMRKLNKSTIFEADSDMYSKFCATFPYIETDDQLLAIDEIIKDLASGVAMDRLLCGDAGFGKTEVAIRASFIVASSGTAQVAVLSPTKILCEQHINVFRERFKGMGLVIEGLHGLKSTKENRSVKRLIREGAINIIIGTHALFSTDIEFANIGLFVIDEEHRFGVKQKERIKNKYPCVHMLSMSATPIPRTLQMALLGVRDLSLLSTAPVGRAKINMFIKPISSAVLYEAAERELSNTGSVFCVCPHIKDISSIEKMLEKIKDKFSCRIVAETLHANMPTKEIEKKITNFYGGFSNFLVSTPMIEVGIDVPRANTIIVYNADLFGLSQLYQLRGRVGRSGGIGYVYFMVAENKVANELKMHKLKIIQSLESLGMGFNVATYDMDIRGFGNLVGSEQSGHIKEVGIDLYQEMLTSSVKEMQSTNNNSSGEALESVKIDIALQALIPDAYIKESTLRLYFYQKIAKAKDNSDLNKITHELRDRFGKVPESVNNLFKIATLRLLAIKNSVSKIAIDRDNVFYITFKNYENPNILLHFLDKNSNDIKLFSNDVIASRTEYDSIALAMEKLCVLLHNLSTICL